MIDPPPTHVRRVTHFASLAVLYLHLAIAAQAEPLPDIRSIKPDLTVPAMTNGKPAPSHRVRRVLKEYRDTQVHHALYLPRDWKPGTTYPVLVEYAGNGPYKNRYGDISTGHVEGSNMGYGISGGKGFLWLCLPYVNRHKGTNQRQWWGDVDATLEYCRRAIRRECEAFGGDPSAVILLGFSRGAIACGYLGLHDRPTADIWLAFVAYSHYDGVRRWGYSGSDAASARKRLARISGRASFIIHEGGGVSATKRFIKASGVKAPFTFRPLEFRNHNDAWTLRDVAERRAVRKWLADVLRDRPGMHTVSGRVVDASGKPMVSAVVESGTTHWTVTGQDGRYSLAGLIDGPRTVRVRHADRSRPFTPRRLTIQGRDESNVDFRASLDAKTK